MASNTYKRDAVYFKSPSMKIQRNWFRWFVSNDEAWKSTISLPIGCGQVSRLSPGLNHFGEFHRGIESRRGKNISRTCDVGEAAVSYFACWRYLLRTHAQSDHLQIFLDLIDWSFVFTFMPKFKNPANLILMWFGLIECVMNWTSLGHIIWISNPALIVSPIFWELILGST